MFGFSCIGTTGILRCSVRVWEVGDRRVLQDADSKLIYNFLVVLH